MPCASSLGSLAPISWSCLPFAPAQMCASIDKGGTARENPLSVRRRILLPHHNKLTAAVNNRAVECLCRCIGQSTRIASLEHPNDFSADTRWLFDNHLQVAIVD